MNSRIQNTSKIKTFKSTEHSENKIITNFENEVEPGVIHFIIQQASSCKNFTQ